MARLYDKQSGVFLGSVTEADMQCLVDQLEEEDQSDDDYFIDQPTIDLLEENGASASFIKLLRGAVGNSDGIDIRYEK